MRSSFSATVLAYGRELREHLRRDGVALARDRLVALEDDDGVRRGSDRRLARRVGRAVVVGDVRPEEREHRGGERLALGEFPAR